MAHTVEIKNAKEKQLRFLVHEPPANREEWDEVGRNTLADFLASEVNLNFPVLRHPELSIIIVLHNNAHLSFLCLKAVLMTTDVPYEVVIVDNASTDLTRNLLVRLTGVKTILNDRNLGFGDACMQAVEQCTGKYLLFLNNDALMQPGAVLAALANFQDAHVGAVGGKILLANGNLQEAGSLVWSDGSALGYGRLQSACSPAYDFRRPVDYCSGAFLFTPRQLFVDLGGFDSCYAPAYYEDTDYCFKVWQAGFRVIYEPGAVIRHYESASSEGNNATPQMAKCQQIFLAKWDKTLARHCLPIEQNILRARIATHCTGLRILYVDDRIPQRFYGAGFPRSNDILRCLVAQGHHLTCVPFDLPFHSPEAEYLGIPREVELLDISADPQLLYRDYLRMADVLWVSRPHNFARFLDGVVGGYDFSAKVVFDAEAIFSHRERIQLSLARRRLRPAIMDARLQRELSLSQAADAVIVVSSREAEIVRQSGAKNVHIIGHRLRAMLTMRPFAARRTFLFIGAIHGNGTPNADSLKYFCEQIWPEVRRRTGAEFVIAGFGTDQVLDLKGEGVNVLGSVADLTPLYEAARVFVVPTRYAAGIPFKAHEAAAYGVPMVVSPLIGEQLSWRHGLDLLVGRNESEFADLCCRLHGDAELWNKMRVNAASRIIREFDPDVFDQKIAEVIDSIVSEK
jgi:GT2 family glycosyltransferase